MTRQLEAHSNIRAVSPPPPARIDPPPVALGCLVNRVRLEPHVAQQMRLKVSQAAHRPPIAIARHGNPDTVDDRGERGCAFGPRHSRDVLVAVQILEGVSSESGHLNLHLNRINHRTYVLEPIQIYASVYLRQEEF